MSAVPPPPPSRRTSTASARPQCSPQDLHRKLRIRVFLAGPQLQALDRSVFPAGPQAQDPRRTPTASSDRSVFPAGPPPQAQDQSVPRRTSTASSGPKCSHRTSTASSRSQWSLPDLNSNLWIKVIPAGPEQQPLDQSDPRRTPTASSRSQCSPPDLRRKL